MHWAAVERKGFFLSQNYLTIECQVVTSGALKAPAASLSYGKCEDENFILKQVLVSCPSLASAEPNTHFPQCSTGMATPEQLPARWKMTWETTEHLEFRNSKAVRKITIGSLSSSPAQSFRRALPPIPLVCSQSPGREHKTLDAPMHFLFSSFPSKSSSFGELRVTMNIIKWRKRQERVHKGACSHRGKRHTAKLPLSFYYSHRDISCWTGFSIHVLRGGIIIIIIIRQIDEID